MKVVDNFNTILNFLDFPDSDVYYYLQILQREGVGKTKQRYSTLISKGKGIDKEEIMFLCNRFIGRAYISVIPRSLKKFTVELSRNVVDRIANNAFVTSTLRLPDSTALSLRPQSERGRHCGC